MVVVLMWWCLRVPLTNNLYDGGDGVGFCYDGDVLVFAGVGDECTR